MLQEYTTGLKVSQGCPPALLNSHGSVPMLSRSWVVCRDQCTVKYTAMHDLPSEVAMCTAACVLLHVPATDSSDLLLAANGWLLLHLFDLHVIDRSVQHVHGSSPIYTNCLASHIHVSTRSNYFSTASCIEVPLQTIACSSSNLATGTAALGNKPGGLTKRKRSVQAKNIAAVW